MSANAPLTPDAQQQEDRKRRRKALLAGGLVLGLGAAVTLAAWSDDVFANGTFVTGSFELQGNPSTTDGDTAGFGNYDTAVSDSAKLTFALNPTDVAPGDVNFAPLSLGVKGSQDATVAIPMVTNSNTALDAYLTYTIYSNVLPSQCNAAGIAGATVAYTGGMNAAGTTVNQVTAPQLSAVPAGIPLCITVTAKNDQALPQAATTTIEWNFSGTSVAGT